MFVRTQNLSSTRFENETLLSCKGFFIDELKLYTRGKIRKTEIPIVEGFNWSFV